MAMTTVVRRTASPLAARAFQANPGSSYVFATVNRLRTIDLASVEEEEEVPRNFPFKIEDNPEEQIVTLTRDYKDEQITVQVHMSERPISYCDGYDDGRGDSNVEPFLLPLVVRISKNKGPCLEFGCTVEFNKFCIDSLTVKNPNRPATKGPDFQELDEDLGKAFHKYLERRGIKPSIANFLNEYMLKKDRREYLVWLKKLKKFTEA